MITSAVLGTALASGYDMERMFAVQARAGGAEVAAAASEELLAAWYDAFAQGGSDPRAVGTAFGRIAMENHEPVAPAVRRSVVETRLVTTDWPASLRVTAMDADTGELHVFDHASGVPLVDAVSASGAVPGIWPSQHFAGRRWIDGGMVSSSNARLAEEFDRILVIASLHQGYGAIPGASADVAALNIHRQAMLIAPDQRSADAIGPNIYDPTRRAVSAAAGRRPAVSIANQVAAVAHRTEPSTGPDPTATRRTQFGR
jgi:NTE family protein